MARYCAGLLVASLCLGGVVADAAASERRFTYVYEATTAPKGEWEFEHWVTWKTSSADNRHFDRFDIRYELEYGVTDRFQLGFYLSDWRYEEDRLNDVDRAKWRDVAIEGIFNLTNPVTDPLGLALYGEVKVGDEFVEVEGKVIAQKNIGPFVLAYNFVVESEWEGDDYEIDNGKIEQTAGISYQFSPRVLVGIEMLHEIDVPDWSGGQGSDVLYIGPNFSYRAERWWVTLTPLFQVSSLSGEPDFETRLIFGFSF